MDKGYFIFLLLAWLGFLTGISTQNITDSEKKKPLPVNIMLAPPDKPSVKESPVPAAPLKQRSKKLNGAVGQRIDAHFVNAEEIIAWLMNRGARLLIVNNEGDPITEVNSQLDSVSSSAFNTKGVWRSVDQEVRRMNNGTLPAGGTHALLFWPKSLFKPIRDLATKHQASHLVLRYRLHRNHLRVEPVRILTINGQWLKGLPTFDL